MKKMKNADDMPGASERTNAGDGCPAGATFESASKATRRYDRQIAFEHIGLKGQERLGLARVAIIGAGGLGSALADMLCRAGVGFLRLVDNDCVELDNLHRQHLFTEADAAQNKPKAVAAADHLQLINHHVCVEPIVARMVAENVCQFIGDLELVLDGTDNWPTRFILNDACVKLDKPWIYTGVLGTEATTMNILPHQTPCMRCIYETPPPPCLSDTCRGRGVLGPAVQAIAAIEALEAI
ncbi:MAG: HesA/MoeB/ThiF family protein, partial [Planctomycetes bacterium]|nr:HesA/MoeB/ThiF family protein [Planctomycetota bacterium]